MAKGRRSRMDLRREAEALEARKQEEELEEIDDEEGDDDGELDDEADLELDDDLDLDSEAEEDYDEDGEPRRKKKKGLKKAAAKKLATKRARVPKEVRTRAVWVVFDNASKVVEKFPFNQKAEAEAFLAKKLEEKKGTFYINLVKEEIKD